MSFNIETGYVLIFTNVEDKSMQQLRSQYSQVLM